MLAVLVNGLPTGNENAALSVEDRGLSYGDGVFETMCLQDGRVRFLESHLTRLHAGCQRLGIAAPDNYTLHRDIAALIGDIDDGVVKLVVTRGAGGRGYRPVKALTATRIAILYPPVSDSPQSGIAVRWCTTRLARNEQLAGIKHLNRLEQVLAQNEWTDEHIAEGLMLDTEGELVSATAGNLFTVYDGVLVTPDLRFSGIRGVMREQVIKLAQMERIPIEERALRPDDLLGAHEVFITNAVRGIRPVASLEERRWPIGAVTRGLMAALVKAPTRDR
jgi:4-amino-4-deoxychorismate lyase